MRRGFTLIELLVVISIIGMLASVLLVALNSARQKGIQGAATEFDSANYHAFGADAVALYNFDDGNASAANPPTDSSGNSNGALTCGAGVSSVSGFQGKGMTLVRTAPGCYSTTYAYTGLNASQGSISFWLYPNTYASGVDTYNIAYVRDLWVSLNTSGTLNLRQALAANSSGTLPLNTWTHVLISWSSAKGTTVIYINGKLDTTVSGLPAFTSTSNFYIGGWGSSNTADAIIDQFAVYTHALQ